MQMIRFSVTVTTIRTSSTISNLTITLLHIDEANFGCYSSRSCHGNFSAGVGKSGCCIAGGGLSYRENITCQECYSKS